MAGHLKYDRIAQRDTARKADATTKSQRVGPNNASKTTPQTKALQGKRLQTKRLQGKQCTSFGVGGDVQITMTKIIQSLPAWPTDTPPRLAL